MTITVTKVVKEEPLSPPPRPPKKAQLRRPLMEVELQYLSGKKFGNLTTEGLIQVHFLIGYGVALLRFECQLYFMQLLSSARNSNSRVT